MTDIDTAVRRMFHMGKPVNVISQTHNISIQRVNKIISNQSNMSNTKQRGRRNIRNEAFNAKVMTLVNRGISKAEIAEIMGCHYSTVLRATRDVTQSKPSKSVAKKISTPTKPKPTNKRTSSFSILWGAITFSRTTSAND